MGARVVAPSWALVWLGVSSAGCALTVTGVEHDTPPPPPRCAAASFQLVRREAEALFVVDRSGSMSTTIATTATGATSRWNALRDALSTALPRHENTLPFGLLLFPSGVDTCGLRGDGHVDVAPARGNSAVVLRALTATRPDGRTPTAAAILYAARYLLGRAETRVSRTIVLATDGAPTCGASSVDDVSEAVAAIAMARALGVDTYVIGISMPGEASLTTALDRMAVAGGHPLPGAVRHYAIHDPAALTQAFTAIPRSISACTWFGPGAAPAEGTVTLRADGALLPRDTGHRDGWDWTDRARGQVTLYGAACARLANRSLTLDATVSCPTP